MTKWLLDLSLSAMLFKDCHSHNQIHILVSRGEMVLHPPHLLVKKTKFPDASTRSTMHSSCTAVRSKHPVAQRVSKLRTLRDLVRPGDYLVKLDLRHAYLVCPLHPHARPATRFRAHGDWQFRTVFFGLRSAPRVFTMLLKPVFNYLRRLGIRLICFIDDVAILADTPLLAVQHAQTVIHLLLRLRQGQSRPAWVSSRSWKCHCDTSGLNKGILCPRVVTGTPIGLP